jgi:hypothetical protein
MLPGGASLSLPCGWPLGVGISAVPRWLPHIPALLSVPALLAQHTRGSGQQRAGGGLFFGNLSCLGVDSR